MADPDPKIDVSDVEVPQNLTVAEVAVVLRMSEAWVRKGVLERTLPFTKLGRSIRFTPGQVKKILREAEQLPRRAGPTGSARRGTARTRL